MRRPTALLLVGTLLLAGCAGLPGTSETDGTDHPTVTPTETASSTQTESDYVRADFQAIQDHLALDEWPDSVDVENMSEREAARRVAPMVDIPDMTSDVVPCYDTGAERGFVRVNVSRWREVPRRYPEEIPHVVRPQLTNETGIGFYTEAARTELTCDERLPAGEAGGHPAGTESASG